ncbi:MAG: energy-coupling factor ABC transporter ATP-binding protein [Actinobacteria bacterium]|nr:energy-coupling factor ABC transporter ATP-binding protein [Actinomycetota bacterium]
MLELVDITFEYNEKKRIFESINFKATSGRLHVFLGRSGSGKTTLLDIAFGFLKPKQGRVYFEGEEVKEPLSSKAVYLISDPERYFFERTVLEEASYPLVFREIAKEKAQAVAKDYLLKSGLSEEYLLRDPLSLSKGEKRRVALVSSLITGSKAIFLDEPISGLDRKGKDAVLSWLRTILSEEKVVLVTAQKLDDFLELKPVVYIISNSKLIEVDFSTARSAYRTFKETGIVAPEKVRIGAILEKSGVKVNLFTTDIEFSEQVARALIKHAY